MEKYSSRLTKQDIIDQLMKNNVELMKKNADLIISMNNLTKKTDELVEIFKKAAEQIHEVIDFFFVAIEVLHRENIKCQFCNTQLPAPVK